MSLGTRDEETVGELDIVEPALPGDEEIDESMLLVEQTGGRMVATIRTTELQEWLHSDAVFALEDCR